MKAAVRDRYGPPEVVRVVDTDRPVPAEDHVLVRVHATTVNRTDCGYRAGTPWLIRLFAGLRRPRASILGTEFAGRIEAVGAAVTAFHVGQRVFGYREGVPRGAHAEYIVVPEAGWLATIPENLTYEQAAPATEGSHYALTTINKVGLGSGADVLVNGATGAIGSALVQLLRVRGANVTAVCGTPHVAMVRGLGAGRVIDYRTEDFTADPRTYDAVIDAVGKSTFRRCRRLMRPGGTYVSSDLGPFWQNPFLALLTPLFRGRKVRFPVGGLDRVETMRLLRELLESGEFRPVIDRRYPLDEIVAAYRYVETGQKVGSVIITVVPEDAG